MDRNNQHVTLYKIHIFAALLLCMFCCNVSAGEIYSYTDQNRVMHFTNVPADSRFAALSFDSRNQASLVQGVKRHKTNKARYESKRPSALSSPDLAEIITHTAHNHGIDPELIKAIIEVESGGRPHARSPKGAVGLMQLMPGTAAKMGVRDRTDCIENIRGGTGYFKTLLEKFNGDIVLALAAYNAGPDTVEKYDGIPPYLETVRYVRKVLEAWNRNRKEMRKTN